MISRIKVVWLCHFTNSEMQKILNPIKKVNEYAPWIPPYINLVREINNIELHVVAPHEYIKGVKYFFLQGVHYYFYNAHMPIIGRHWPGFFKWDYLTNFYSNKRIVKKLINKIKPNLIHLHGAENAYFSSTILQFLGKFPIIFTLQGMISLSTEKKSYQIKKRIKIEKTILSKIQHAFYSTETMKIQMNEFNTKIKFYWNDYPTGLVEKVIDSKIYDLVFFARITKDKGIGDLIKALAIIKKEICDISLCVIGGGKLEFWKKLAKEENVSENIQWIGFLPTQKEVHQIASKAKISVLPTYHDMIPGTIIESMLLDLPVVAYDVGSIKEINSKEEIVTLVNKNDIKGLANAILILLKNSNLRNDIGNKGLIRAREMFLNKNHQIKSELLLAYQTAINDFH